MIIVVLLSTIWTFNDFQIVYILTKGGPGGTTMVMPVLTYEDGVRRPAARRGHRGWALYLLPALAGRSWCSRATCGRGASGEGDERRPDDVRVHRARDPRRARAVSVLLMTITSFKNETRSQPGLDFLAAAARHGELEQLLGKTDFVAWYRNSATVAISSTLLATSVGTIGAYALARLRFFGRGFMASATLITYLVPPSILFIPLYAQMRNLGLATASPD